MKERRKNNMFCTLFNPLCMTLIFMFGAVVGMLLTDISHYSLVRNVVVIGFATLAFHLTQNNKFLFSRKEDQ